MEKFLVVQMTQYGNKPANYEDGDYRCSYDNLEDALWVAHGENIMAKHRLAQRPYGRSDAKTWVQVERIDDIGGSTVVWRDGCAC